jgi:beta-glucosidase
VYIAFGWLHEGEWPPSKKGQFLLGYYTYLNLASAHNKVVRMARKTAPHLRLGTTKNTANHYAGDKSLKTKFILWFTMYMEDYLYLDHIKRNMDWVGINYYFSNRYTNGRQNNEVDYIQDLGWEMQPENISHVLERIYKKYKKPLLITENGVADYNDKYRKWWIAHTLDAIHSSIKKGVKVEGYLHWSLLDNFEWAYGKWPRFGLIEVDYRTMKRTPRSSAIWFGKVIKSMRGL